MAVAAGAGAGLVAGRALTVRDFEIWQACALHAARHRLRALTCEAANTVSAAAEAAQRRVGGNLSLARMRDPLAPEEQPRRASRQQRQAGQIGRAHV